MAPLPDGVVYTMKAVNANKNMKGFEQPPQMSKSEKQEQGKTEPPKRRKPGWKETLAAGVMALGISGEADKLDKEMMPDSGARVSARASEKKEEGGDFEISPQDSVENPSKSEQDKSSL